VLVNDKFLFKFFTIAFLTLNFLFFVSLEIKFLNFVQVIFMISSILFDNLKFKHLFLLCYEVTLYYYHFTAF